MSKQNKVTLGWTLNDDGHPSFWLDGELDISRVRSGDLFDVETDALANHTIIFAQSGSGKSFLLGRIIEDIAAFTKARVVVFDPNSDYSKLKEINADVFKEPKYNKETGMGKLPTESLEEFQRRWKSVSIRQYVGNTQMTGSDIGTVSLKLDVGNLSPQLILEGIDARSRQKLETAHDFIKTVLRFLRGPFSKKQIEEEMESSSQLLADRLSGIFESSRTLPEDIFYRFIASQYIEDPAKVFQELFDVGDKSADGNDPKKAGDDEVNRVREANFKKLITQEVYSQCRRICQMAAMTDKDIFDALVVQIKKLEMKGLVADLNDGGFTHTEKVSVINLPSIQEELRLLAVDNVLKSVWSFARNEWENAIQKPPSEDGRVPIFIVVDEAHNLISSDPNSPSAVYVVDQFRRIAAEGRKFGLFLILVSQRPEKIDPFVSSECQSKFVMKIGSSHVLESAASYLGLSDEQVKALNDAVSLTPGKAFLIGPLSGNRQDRIPKIMIGARRTIEGGRGLPSLWTEDILKQDGKKGK